MEPKKTPLYEVHVSSGARIVDFAGFLMPVQYKGVIEEHLAVRNNCGLFDVSHMGEIEVSGASAHEFVQNIATNDIDRIGDGQCQYTLLCQPDGGVVDDTIVYRYNKDRYLFVVNASNTDKAFEWMRKQASNKVDIENISANYAQLALQGPKSAEVIDDLLDVPPSEIKHFHFHMGMIAGIEAIISRTGYTGEDGFEIYFDPADAVEVWNAIMEAGKDFGIQPIGLGARDTLRLEMCYPLYGHELSEKLTPIQAGLNKYVRFNKDFIGKEVLERQVKEGVDKALVGFRMKDPGIARAEYEIFSKGKKTGWVTSGTSSPSLKAAIGMGYVAPSLKEPGTEIDIMIRNRAAKAEVVKTPFYKK